MHSPSPHHGANTEAPPLLFATPHAAAAAAAALAPTVVSGAHASPPPAPHAHSLHLAPHSSPEPSPGSTPSAPIAAAANAHLHPPLAVSLGGGDAAGVQPTLYPLSPNLSASPPADSVPASQLHVPTVAPHPRSVAHLPVSPQPIPAASPTGSSSSSAHGAASPQLVPRARSRNYYDEEEDDAETSPAHPRQQQQQHQPQQQSQHHLQPHHISPHASHPHSRSHSPHHHVHSPHYPSHQQQQHHASSHGGRGSGASSPMVPGYAGSGAWGAAEAAEASRRDEVYWEAMNSATYPSRRPTAAAAAAAAYGYPALSAATFAPPPAAPASYSGHHGSREQHHHSHSNHSPHSHASHLHTQQQRPAYYSHAPSPQPGAGGRSNSISSPSGPYAYAAPPPQQHQSQPQQQHYSQHRSRGSTQHGSGSLSPWGSSSSSAGGGRGEQHHRQASQQPPPVEWSRASSERGGSYHAPPPPQQSSPHSAHGHHHSINSSGSSSGVPYMPPTLHHAASMPYASGGGSGGGAARTGMKHPHLGPGSMQHAASYGSPSLGAASSHNVHTDPPPLLVHDSSTGTNVSGSEGHCGSGAVSPTSTVHSPADAANSAAARRSSVVPIIAEGESSSPPCAAGDDDCVISRWLRSLNLSTYAPLFLKHKVSLDQLVQDEISEADLISIGVDALGVRKKILKAARLEKEERRRREEEEEAVLNAIAYASGGGGGTGAHTHHGHGAAADEEHHFMPHHFVGSHSRTNSSPASPRSISRASTPTSMHHALATMYPHAPLRDASTGSGSSGADEVPGAASQNQALALHHKRTLHAGPQPISHHPNSDLSHYTAGHGEGRYHPQQQHMPSHYVGGPRERNGSNGGGGGAPSPSLHASFYPHDALPSSFAADLPHARSQSSDSLHQQLILHHSAATIPGIGHHVSSSSSSIVPSSSPPLHISFLQASPLLHSESPGRSHAIDADKETELIRDSLGESGRAFRVRFAIATKTNLLKMLTKGTRALHISGHGDPHHLILENGSGGVEALSQDVLRNMLIVGGSELQFVFISSCFSYRAAVAFLAAGVRHVIAVQEDTQVSDTAARAFAAHVYLALCQGRSVKDAFAKGQAAVLATGHGKAEACCCAHLHAPSCRICETCRSPLCCSSHAAPCHVLTSCCSPSVPHGESLKFLLLPPEDPANGITHDVRLFADVESGPWLNVSPPRLPNNLPAIDHFTGRSSDEYSVVQLVLSSRLTTITGRRGIGKSALARAVGSYVNERRHFEHGVFLIKVGHLTHGLHGALSPHLPHLHQHHHHDDEDDHHAHPVAEVDVATELNLRIARALCLDFTHHRSAQAHREARAMHGQLKGVASLPSVSQQPQGDVCSPENLRAASKDPERLQHELFSYLQDKHILLLLDDADELLLGSQHRPAFKAWIKSFLDRTQSARLLITANLAHHDGMGSQHYSSSSSSGTIPQVQGQGQALQPPAAGGGGSSGGGSLIHAVGIPGHTSKLYQLGPLHPLDSAALLVHRFPRDLRAEEYGRMRSLADLGDQLLLRRLRGNPRMLEWSAEMLNHLALEQLSTLLCEPVPPVPTEAKEGARGPAAHPSLATLRMRWIEQQACWPQLSAEAQTLLRRLVRLLESGGSAPAMTPIHAAIGHLIDPVGSPGAPSPQPPLSSITVSSSGAKESSALAVDQSRPRPSSLTGGPEGEDTRTHTAEFEGAGEGRTLLLVDDSHGQSGSSPLPADTLGAFTSPSLAHSSGLSPALPQREGEPTAVAQRPVKQRTASLWDNFAVARTASGADAAAAADATEDDSDAYDANAPVLSPRVAGQHGDTLHAHAFARRGPPAAGSAH